MIIDDADPVMEPDTVAEEDPEAIVVGTVKPAAEHVLANACNAAPALEPQRFVIWVSTFEASDPQIVLRSAGLCSVLTAAKRHAGGLATTSLAQEAKSARITVDLAETMLCVCRIGR